VPTSTLKNIINDLFPRSAVPVLDQENRTYPTTKISPKLNNVCFASGEFGFSFTLRQFAQIYAERNGGGIKVGKFTQRFWGNKYFERKNKKFVKKEHAANTPRRFVQFVLEPLYKLISQVVGEEPDILKVSQKKKKRRR